jgi:hypothetical protein
MISVYSILYLIFALGICIYFTFYKLQTNRILGFTVMFWIMTESILSQDIFIPTIAALGGSIQPNRVLLFVAFLTIFYQKLKGNNIASPMWPMEKMLVLLFTWLLVVFFSHFVQGLTFQYSLLVYLNWLVFILTFFALQSCWNEELMDAIFNVIIITAVISTFIGIVQLFVDQQFMRVGAGRIAFKNVLRSSGLFQADYTQIYFCLIAWIIAVMRMEKGRLRSFVLYFTPLGMFLTFHRAGALIFLGIMIFYLIKYWELKGRILLGLGFLAGLFLFYLLVGQSTLFTASGFFSGGIQERMSDDTISGRFAIYYVVLQRIPDFFWMGIGTKFSNIYYMDMFTSGQTYAVGGEVGGVHNLYLNLAYLYGVPASLFMFSFIVTVIASLLRKIELDKMAFIPLSVSCVYFFGNFSNWFYPDAEFSIIVIIVLGLGIGLMKKKHEVIED